MNFKENVNIYTRLTMIVLLIKSIETKARLLKNRLPEKMLEDKKKTIELIRYLQNDKLLVEPKEIGGYDGIEYDFSDSHAAH